MKNTNKQRAQNEAAKGSVHPGSSNRCCRAWFWHSKGLQAAAGGIQKYPHARAQTCRHGSNTSRAQSLLRSWVSPSTTKTRSHPETKKCNASKTHKWARLQVGCMRIAKLRAASPFPLLWCRSFEQTPCRPHVNTMSTYITPNDDSNSWITTCTIQESRKRRAAPWEARL